jgi:glycosyltransferase involved in cell wall biosynthesis
MKISAVIIALNEEDHMADCVRQARKFCDEVIVIDAESSDQTVELAKANGAQVVVRPWQGFGPTKNFGNDLARNDWILSLDADEVLSDQWIENNRSLVPENGKVYRIDLVTFYFGKRLRHSGFYPLWKNRLFNRKEARWNEDAVHEALVFNKKVSFHKLKGKVWHYSFKSREAYRSKLDMYARLGAEKWIKQGKNINWLKKTAGPAFRFFKTYILDLGLLDGRAGLEIAKMNMEANRAKIRYYFRQKAKG